MRALATIALAALLGWIAAALYRPPSVLPATAGEDSFSAERALSHVEVIAAEAHPVGSERNRAVGDFLVGELRKLGLETHVQEAEVALRPDEQPVRVRNILAHRPGRATTRAVMLAAHYDSVRHGPGAGDNAAAVAAVLETIRALNAAPPLRNDLIILFSDGEEAGLLGARAFVGGDSWFERVGLVFNFDARGNSGPVLMYETSASQAPLIRELSRVGEPVFATSLAAFVYRRMPNNTDFSVYLDAGLEGLNFAFIDGFEHYHKASDTPANLDRGSLQHAGGLMLGLARHFGNLELPLSSGGGDRLYFNVVGSWLVHYPVKWVLPVAMLLAAGAGVVLWRGGRAGFLRLGKVFSSAGCLTLGLTLAGASVIWTGPILRRAAGAGVELAVGLGFAGFFMISAHVASRRLGTWLEVAAATAVLWVIGATALAVWLPEASYLMFWPAAVVWFGIARALGRKPVLPFAGTMCVAAVLFGPLLHLLGLAFPRSATVVVLPAALLVPLALVILDPWITPGERRDREPTAGLGGSI